MCIDKKFRLSSYITLEEGVHGGVEILVLFTLIKMYQLLEFYFLTNYLIGSKCIIVWVLKTLKDKHNYNMTCKISLAEIHIKNTKQKNTILLY